MGEAGTACSFGTSKIHDNIENMQNQTQSNSWGNNNAQWGVDNTSLAQNNNAYLDFNGKELRWHQNNKVTNSWKAMSGQPDYQCKEFTNVSNKGPIPEGVGIMALQDVLILHPIWMILRECFKIMVMI